MREIHGYINSRIFLMRSPFRSPYFLVISIVGLGVIAVDTYIICRYWRILSMPLISVLGVLIGIQIVYQWLRALRYYSQIRQLYAMETAKGGNVGTVRETALGVAVGAMTDMLFYSFAMVLVALIIIAFLLAHIGAA